MYGLFSYIWLIFMFKCKEIYRSSHGSYGISMFLTIFDPLWGPPLLVLQHLCDLLPFHTGVYLSTSEL